MLFENDQRILFIGDSITDCGRRDQFAPLGNGYVSLAANFIETCYPQLNLEFFNRGIGGNSAADLLKRWQEDCLDIEPHWVSILVGINDVHRWLDGSRDDTDPQQYRRCYRTMLETLAPGTGLILWQPFYLLTAQSTLPKAAEHIGQYISTVDQLAEEFSARLIRTQEVFEQACDHRGAEFWMPEGVHPSPAGHGMLACQFLKTIGWRLQFAAPAPSRRA